MKLLIDIGNSRIKWLYGNEVPGIIEAVSYKSHWQEKLYRAFHLMPTPDTIGLSSVNHPEIEETIITLAERLWQQPVHIFHAQKQTKDMLTVGYEDAATLGTDRYLAMLGARGLCQEALCVVGCGTAITLDVIDAQGHHLGGIILPGIRLMENALLNHTQKLRPMRWTAQLIGNDTATCIGAGIHHAIPAGIDGIMDELEGKHGQYFRRYAFGGDAQILFGTRPSYCIEPDLIFRGMFTHLTYSHQQSDL